MVPSTAIPPIHPHAAAMPLHTDNEAQRAAAQRAMDGLEDALRQTQQQQMQQEQELVTGMEQLNRGQRALQEGQDKLAMDMAGLQMGG